MAPAVVIEDVLHASRPLDRGHDLNRRLAIPFDNIPAKIGHGILKIVRK